MASLVAGKILRSTEVKFILKHHVMHMRNTIVSSYCLLIIIRQLKSLKFENKENYFQTRAAGLLLVNLFRGERRESIKDIYILFNRDLNHGCFVYMFSLPFSGSKFLINLRLQFRVRKIFLCT